MISYTKILDNKEPGPLEIPTKFSLEKKRVIMQVLLLAETTLTFASWNKLHYE
jgi:hypothetical protein